jgi:hypothetical protein
MALMVVVLLARSLYQTHFVTLTNHAPGRDILFVKNRPQSRFVRTTARTSSQTANAPSMPDDKRPNRT